MAIKARSQYFPIPAHISQTVAKLAADPIFLDNARAASALLIPPEIDAVNGPIPSPPALPDLEVWGVNEGAAVTTHEQGLKVHVPAWSDMNKGDSVNLLLEDLTVATDTIRSDAQVGERLSLFIADERLAAGSQAVSYKVTRFGQQPEASAEMNIYVKLTPPGGPDADGTDQGHSELVLTLPEEIMHNGVGADEAEEGVIVKIDPYPEMALWDHIKLSWGGIFVDHYVTEEEVGSSLEITVDKDTILKAGDSGANSLAVAFMVYDVVQNPSSDWSAEALVTVDTGNARFDAPIVKEARNRQLNLETLNGKDATLQLWVPGGGKFEVGDKIWAKMVGTTTEGIELSWTAAEPDVVDNLPQVLEISVPNDRIRLLAKTQAVFSYEVEHQGTEERLRSKGEFISIIGEPVRLAAPIVEEEQGGALDPELATAHVKVPWDDAFQKGDMVVLRWIGTYPDYGPYDPVLDAHFVSAGDTTDQEPIIFAVPGKHLKEIEGGTVDLFYVLAKDVDGVTLERESAHTGPLNVGEERAELRAPIVEGIVDNALPPDHSDTTLKVVPYRGMAIRDEIHITWDGSITGKYVNYLPVTSLNHDKEVVFPIKDDLVKGNEGGKVAASYKVVRANGDTSYSDVLEFSVGEPVALDPPVFTSVKDSAGNEIPKGGSTADKTVTLTGTAAADQTLRILDGETDVAEVGINADGEWETTLNDLAVASHRIEAVANYTSSPQSAVYNFTVADTARPVITRVTDSKGELIPNGGSTSDTSVTLYGTFGASPISPSPAIISVKDSAGNIIANGGSTAADSVTLNGTAAEE